MKKLFLLSTCLALTSTAAMAADMGVPYTKAPVMAAPVFTWTGCYVGAHIGGGSLSTGGAGLLNSEGSLPSNFASDSSTGRGGVAGGQLGCNYQDGNWVFGLEGEGYWSGIKANVNRSFGVNDTESLSMKNSNDFTIAARAGITFDRTFIYGKGGWAWGNYKVTGTELCCGPGATPFTNINQSGYLDGFLVGLGIEHALTRNWTVKLEYDYIGYGTRNLAITNCSGGVCSPTNNGSTSVSSNKQLFKVGFNYLFDVGGFR
jgi:outer membrane immunogenic protein